MQSFNFNKVKQCRHGPMCYNVHDIYVGQSLENYGEFSQGEVDLFAQMVGPNDVVVEVGRISGRIRHGLARRWGRRAW